MEMQKTVKCSGSVTYIYVNKVRINVGEAIASVDDPLRLFPTHEGATCHRGRVGAGSDIVVLRGARGRGFLLLKQSVRVPLLFLLEGEEGRGGEGALQ